MYQRHPTVRRELTHRGCSVPSAFWYAVRTEVLAGSGNTERVGVAIAALHRAYVSNRHRRYEAWVFAERFLDAAPTACNRRFTCL